MKKYDYVCRDCHSPVVVDAYAQWDVETQDYILVSTFDHEYCRTCDGETHSIEIEINKGETRCIK